MPVALALLALGTACGSSHATTPTTTPSTTRTLEIVSARELGPIGAPASVNARDGGAAALVGGRLLWTFGDTLFSPAAADGRNLRSNTAALADVLAPLVVSEPLDSKGAPFQFLPFDAQELAYNNSTGRADQRIALWPTGVVADGGGAWVFYLKLRVNPGVLNYEFIGTGLARVEAGKTSAARETQLLFNAPEPLFGRSMLVGDMVYVYGALLPQTAAHADAVARVPREQVATRAAYRFWDGNAWVEDARRAVAVLSGIPGEVSVSPNAYLGHYLAVHSQPLSDRVVMHVADAPEGPWGPALEAFTAQSGVAGATCYAGQEHPELATNGGRTVVVSYYRPDAPFKGALRLTEVTFK